LAGKVFLVYDGGMKQLFFPTIGCPLLAVSLTARQHMLPLTFAMLFPVMLLFGQVASAWSAPYHGQVVDAETGKPIEGAVAMIEWHKKPRIAMGGINYFHNARETLTDVEGKFSLDSSPGIDWNPLTYIQTPPWIVVFYPGYRPFTPAYPEDIGIKGSLKNLDAFEGGVVVKLTKLTSEKELRSFTSKGGFGPVMAPYAIIPNLFGLINIQRKSLGIEELRLP